MRGSLPLASLLLHPRDQQEGEETCAERVDLDNLLPATLISHQKQGGAQAQAGMGMILKPQTYMPSGLLRNCELVTPALKTITSGPPAPKRPLTASTKATHEA